MGVFDMRDGPSHGSSAGDGPADRSSEDGTSEGGTSEGSEEDSDADAPIRILEGHSVWFNEYRY